jgi:hypothetical protein
MQTAQIKSKQCKPKANSANQKQTVQIKCKQCKSNANDANQTQTAQIKRKQCKFPKNTLSPTRLDPVPRAKHRVVGCTAENSRQIAARLGIKPLRARSEIAIEEHLCLRSTATLRIRVRPIIRASSDFLGKSWKNPGKISSRSHRQGILRNSGIFASSDGIRRHQMASFTGAPITPRDQCHVTQPRASINVSCEH